MAAVSNFTNMITAAAIHQVTVEVINQGLDIFPTRVHLLTTQ